MGLNNYFRANARKWVPSLALLTLVLIFLVVNARWIWVYRHDSVLDIDEAGYLNYSLIDYYGLLYGGFAGWISAIEIPSIQAPLTMALSSLVYYVAGPHIILGFAIPLVAGAGSILAVYAIGQSVGSARVGLAAAALTATCPAIITYSRTYNFAVPLTFITLIALLAILRSRNFRNVFWTIIFGIALGLMPLTRTMSIAFIPGLLAAAALVVLIEPVDRYSRSVKLVWAVVLAILIAATWFWTNGMLVAQYLLNFGYGGHAAEYGPKMSMFGFDAWTLMAQDVVRNIYLLHFLVILVGVVCAFFIAFWELTRVGASRTLVHILNSPLLPIVIFVVEGILILTTTSNKGSGFVTPLVPPLLVLAAGAYDRLSQKVLIRRGMFTFAFTLGAAAMLPMLDLHTPFAAEITAHLPLLGGVTITDGRGIIQKYESLGGYGAPNAIEPVSKENGQAWVNLSKQTAETLTKDSGQQVIVMFGFRNELYNVNTVNLAELLATRSAFSMRQIDPIITGESIEGYRSWLEKEGVSACALLTSDRLGGDFLPAINREFMQEAAKQDGFVPVQNWPAPDGQIITLWRPRNIPSNCSNVP